MAYRCGENAGGLQRPNAQLAQVERFNINFGPNTLTVALVLAEILNVVQVTSVHPSPCCSVVLDVVQASAVSKVENAKNTG